MALTIEDQPTAALVRPTFAPIELLLSTDTDISLVLGFKIVCKVYLDPNGTDTLISTQQIYLIPNTTQAVFSVQDVIKSYVADSYSVINGDTVDVAETSLSDFRLTFEEFYDGALRGGSAISNLFTAWYASPSYVEFAANDWHNWQMKAGDIDKEFLNAYGNQAYKFTSFDLNDHWLKLKPTQKYQIQWLQEYTASDAGIEIHLDTFDSNFTSIISTTIAVGATNVGHYSLDVGPAELAAHSWAASVVMTNVRYYVLTVFETNDPDQEMKSILFEVDSCDTNYTPYELHWLNRKGGYDSMTFDGKSKESTSINKSFAKYANSNVVGTSLSYKTSNQRTRAFHTGLKTNYQLNSRLLKDFEMQGLADLYSSPSVYWNSPNGFVSVNAEMTTFNRAKSEDGKVFSVEVTISIDNSDERQW